MNKVINVNFGKLFNCGYWEELPESVSGDYKNEIIHAALGVDRYELEDDVIKYVVNNVNYNKGWEQAACDACINIIQNILNSDPSIKDIKIVSAEPFAGGYAGCGVSFTCNKEVDGDKEEKFIYSELKDDTLGDLVDALSSASTEAYYPFNASDMKKMYSKLNIKFDVPDSEIPKDPYDFVHNFKRMSDGKYHFKNDKQRDLFKATSGAKSRDAIIKSIIENARGSKVRGYNSYCVSSEFWIGHTRYTLYIDPHNDEDLFDDDKWNKMKIKEYLKDNDFEDIKIKSTSGSNKGDVISLEDAIAKEMDGSFKSVSQFSYNGKRIIASSKEEAIKKIIADKQMSDEEIFEKAKNGDKSILELPEDRLKIKDKYGWTPIHLLAMKEVKEILKLPKELLMIKNNDGWTPIHYLAIAGVKEILKLPKSILMIQNNDGWTPIHYLAVKGVKEVLKLPKSILKIQDKDGYTPVHYLAKRGVKEVLNLDKELLMIQDKYEKTPVHYLAKTGVKEVLNLPKSILMIQDKYGYTPVHDLANSGVKIPDKYKLYI